MNRTMVALVLVIALLGCSQDTRTPMEGVIVEIQEEDPEIWGCMGTNYITIVKAANGHVASWCGKFGKPSDTLTGVWVEGHLDATANGFHR